MEFAQNQIVVLRNGNVGVTASFNGRAFQLIFAAYSCPVGRYNSDLKTKNSDYDVVEIFDGTGVENVTAVFKKGFKTDGLKSIWKREENG